MSFLDRIRLRRRPAPVQDPYHDALQLYARQRKIRRTLADLQAEQVEQWREGRP